MKRFFGMLLGPVLALFILPLEWVLRTGDRWLSGRPIFRDVTHGGLCDWPDCRNPGMVFLDGREVLCWDHYCEVMKEKRDERAGRAG